MTAHALPVLYATTRTAPSPALSAYSPGRKRSGAVLPRFITRLPSARHNPESFQLRTTARRDSPSWDPPARLPTRPRRPTALRKAAPRESARNRKGRVGGETTTAGTRAPRTATRTDGRAAGPTAGSTARRDDGIDDGRIEGPADGRDDGRIEGRPDGQGGPRRAARRRRRRRGRARPPPPPADPRPDRPTDRRPMVRRGSRPRRLSREARRSKGPRPRRRRRSRRGTGACLTVLGLGQAVRRRHGGYGG